MSNLASKKQLRYLLHGKQEHFDDIDTPLYITSQDSSLWQKIAQQVLEQKQELWRLIDGSLASELLEKQQQYLIISSLQAKQVINLIKELGAESVKGESLSPEEREELLIEASNNEIELWKNLKLHEDINGTLVSIGENTYLNIPEINIELPQQLQGKVTLIKLSNNPLHSALQHQHICEWNHKTAINFLLDQQQPHRYFEYILKLLNQLNTDDKRDINKKLKQTKWFTDSICKIVIAPQDVIDIKHEKLKKHISIIVKLEEGKYTTSDLHHQLKNEQKLSSLFSYWDENYVIDKILSCPNPHEKCWIILDALDSLLSNNNNYDDPNLSAVAWLITTENKPISPANVIYHDELKKDIQYIFTEADNQHIESKYVGFLMINKEIKSKYPNVWEWLQKKLFINKIDDIIDKLEEIIKKLPNYGLGSFTHPNHLTIEDINKWIETKIFHHIDDKILPCWSLLKKIYPPQRKKILPSLQSSSLNPERFVAILNYLSEHFKGNDKDAIAVYNKYLQSACTDVETFRDSILPNIQLLNQKNEWKSPQKLCPNLDNSHDNISNLYLLNNEQAYILNEQAYILIELLEQSYKTCNKKNDRQANVEKEKSEIALVLKDYFRDWEKYIPSELIGGFLCFLSHRENQELEKLVQKYLVNRDLQITFERVLPRSSRDRKFQIKVNQTRSGNLVEVISITGKPFQAEINNENDYKNLITKTPQYNKNTGVLEITFVSKPNIDNLSAAKLIELLKESTKWIIIHVYRNGEETTKKEIDNLFDDLDKSEQLPIQVAKNVLLNDLRQTLTSSSFY